MAALLKWIEGVELLLQSEPFQVTDSATMEEQVLQYRVGAVTPLRGWYNLTIGGYVVLPHRGRMIGGVGEITPLGVLMAGLYLLVE